MAEKGSTQGPRKEREEMKRREERRGIRKLWERSAVLPMDLGGKRGDEEKTREE